MWEETGLDVSACAGGPALTYHREHPGEGDNYFVDCYLFTLPFAPEQVKIRPNEALEYKLATLEEIQELAQQGTFCIMTVLMMFLQNKAICLRLLLKKHSRRGKILW